MANKRVNVLVYAGNGSTPESVRHCLYSLRRLLSPNYAVIPVTGDVILKEPWTASCALLVFPGGADLGYCRTLNGEGNRRIKQFLQRGGTYLGLCAGGYYGCKRCEWEVGDKKMEVIGSRELGLFPGICRGCAFSGFVYHSEAGARAAELKVEKGAFSEEELPDSFRTYYNGGGVFVDAPNLKNQGVEILASYTEKLHVDPGEGAAAVVYCKVGEGAAVLTGPHPEFAAVNLDKSANGPDYPKLVEELAADEQARASFLRACLSKLGLRVSKEQTTVPSLSLMHLSSAEPPAASELVSSWKELITKEEGKEYIKGENDTFEIDHPSKWSLGSLAKALPGLSGKPNSDDDAGQPGIDIDYSKIIKRIHVHETEQPSFKETPYFNHASFYANLQNYHARSKESEGAFGRYLLYGEVVTSTSTLLEKNLKLLQHLPTGFTATATTQVAGRGRGSNVWVSPAGTLLFSTCIRHPMHLMNAAPVVFVQYLAAIAIVEGIRSYDVGYADLPVKLKWPNDIYAQDPSKGPGNYVKIGGILVNSSYVGSEFLLVVGIGLNTMNPGPTTSLNDLLPPHLPPFTLEKLLARILSSFESIYNSFLRTGFNHDLESLYYSLWLHTDQIVTLEAEGSIRARIRGITRDYGLLVAEELGWEDRPTGRVIQLQSDSNSFDFFKGLVKRKV
ncbi:class II aaRS and biotin synthetase [Xylona heveae TC161]|uniref:Class II aaRS and biotin synthetase n=1 Tax=Xylona heveae (strain CBS 132557 / TC161) TaxID=1328760 RepID=A0A165GYI9_XYLHT|nr:class II aaRS and biotin synthetase [Xylona heveae TC161]KZF22765.1 class II aaRS and biotin synthetase [Xylona heveae TC161]